MKKRDMAYHPLNLAHRFFLEIGALAALALYGWKLTDGPFRIVAAIGLPLVAAVLWGTFAVPDDPSRSGNAPIPVPGLVRLALELAILGFATWTLFTTKFGSWGLALGGLTLLHYLISYERISWLIKTH
jgi:hypothetical protein